MSAETLKFFEDKSTEAIINWMLSHLQEDQIRMCLDQSGIPDTSGIAAASATGGGGKAPMYPPSVSAAASAAASAASGPDRPKSSDAGGSEDPLPPPPSPVSPPVHAAVSKKFLDTYRRKCDNTPYLIKNVTKEDGVEYYEFKEIEDSDRFLNPTLKAGEAGWVYSKTPISQFRGKCIGKAPKDLFDMMKEEYPDEFIGASKEVLSVAYDYVSSGLVSPIPKPVLEEIAEEAGTVEVSESTPVGQLVEITDPMLKALKIQQGSTEWIQQNYPYLHSKGLRMYPIFVYGADGPYVNHLTGTVKDSKLTLVHERTHQGLFNRYFKKKIEQIDDSVKAGLYIPSDDMREELSAALEQGEIAQKIQYIYDKDRLDSLTLFGGLDDEPWIKPETSSESFGEVPQLPLFLEEQPEISRLMSHNVLDESPAAASSSSKSKDVPLPPGVKKVSDMSIPEIEERMEQLFGRKYVLDYKPVITTRKDPTGEEIKTVQYVKRTNEPEIKPVEFQPFAEFKEGNFGEDEIDLGEELLFG